MEKLTSSNLQFDYFLTNLGLLLESRIIRHHRTNCDEVEFFNNFIIVPQQDGFEFDDIVDAASERNHFENNLGIKFLQIELMSLSLSQAKDICYGLFIYIKLFEDDFEPMFVKLINNKFVYFDTDCFESLEKLDDETWKKLNRQLDEEISFGTLSLR